MKIVFMGTPAAAVPSLSKLLADGHTIMSVFTQPDRPSGRGNKVTFSPVKQFAVDHGLVVQQPAKINTSEALINFRSYEADVAVVVAYGRILPESFLNAFSYGAINVHFSLLPKFRGAAPVNWAIVKGETSTGVTTMKMDRGLDTGDILLQAETAIGPDENAVGLTERLSDLGAELISATLSQINTIVPVKQIETSASYAPILKKEDGHFNWTNNAIDITRRVRGFQPFPTTFTFLNGKRLTLWKTAPIDLTPKPAGHVTGRIAAINDEGVIVECGENTFIWIVELQIEGKKRMAARDFMNGSGLNVGSIIN